MTSHRPSPIMAQRLQQFDDLRSLFPKRPDPPAHHVRIEELHEAMACCNPAFKGRVSLSDLVDICRSLNAKLDGRQTGMRMAVAPELPEVGKWVPSGNFIPRSGA